MKKNVYGVCGRDDGVLLLYTGPTKNIPKPAKDQVVVKCAICGQLYLAHDQYFELEEVWFFS